MSRMLNFDPPGSSRPPVGGTGLTVGDVRYSHAAAQFWSSLMDEVTEDYPRADRILLEALCDDLLTPDMLDPARLFSEELATLQDGAAMDETLRDVSQELELLGPPSRVRVRVSAGEQLLIERDLPEDVIDAELFPVFVVWPLEWAGLSEFAWNRRSVSGSFLARDEERDLQYEVRVSLENRHLREGLFDRSLLLEFSRTRGTPV